MSESDKSTVTIKGVFLGQPIDLVICEGEQPEDKTDGSDPVAFVPPSQDAAFAGRSAEADPAPDSETVTDAPKNPAGNSEQL